MAGVPLIMKPDQRLKQSQELAAEASRSVVSVETITGGGRNTRSVVCAGSVLHKSANHTYILTYWNGFPKNCRVQVWFHDHNQGEKAKVLIRKPGKCQGAKVSLTVLRVDGIHESSPPIEFRAEPINFSSALCVVPKTRSVFHKIQGFIPTPSLASNDMTGNVPGITEDHFVFVCPHHDTEIMKSAPVFHTNGQVNGFVIEACNLPFYPGDEPGADLVDIEAKICVKQRHLEAWLRKVSGDNDWRAGLEKWK